MTTFFLFEIIDGNIENIIEVLSWNVIIETLLEGDYAQRMGDDGDGPAAAHLVSRFYLSLTYAE